MKHTNMRSLSLPLSLSLYLSLSMPLSMSLSLSLSPKHRQTVDQSFRRWIAGASARALADAF